MAISLTTRIQWLEVPKGSRMLAVSDIHGHCQHLRRLLTMAEFSEKDILFIVGDIVEKGPESLKTLRYVMDLCERYQVYPSIGNVDQRRVQRLEDLTLEGAQVLLEDIKYRRIHWGSSLFKEMCREQGLPCETVEEVRSSQPEVLCRYEKELDFLRSLPTIIETRNFTFVHSGLPQADIRELEGTPSRSCLKVSAFLDKGLSFPKWVVVGHWPVCLYDGRRIQSNPIFLPERKIISMDGGCGLKSDGQLNLLIIPDQDADTDQITHLYYDGFPLARALDVQEESRDSINIRFIDNQVEVLATEEDFCQIRHCSSGHVLWVPEDILYMRNGVLVCDDFSDYRLPVKPGDVLAIFRKTSRGYLVKKDGVSSWYEGRLERIGKGREDAL